MTQSIHSRALAATAAVLGLTLAGCSDSPSGPDGTGNGYAQAIVTDNPNTTSPTAAEAPVFSISGNAESAEYTGTISGDMSVSISADGEVWYDLGSPNGITVQAQSTVGGTNVHGEVTVPAGSYNRVRLTMSDAMATIEAGAVIGGLTLTADAEVQLGAGGQIVIEKQVETFTVTADASARTEILFDLNTEVWLTQDNVEQGEASDQEVEDACQSETRTVERTQQ